MVVRRALNLSVGTLATMLPVLVLIGVALLVVFFVGQRFRLFGRDITLAPTSLANERPGEPREVSLYTLLPKDGIRSIDDPQFLPPHEAAPDLAELQGQARPVPQLPGEVLWSERRMAGSAGLHRREGVCGTRSQAGTAGFAPCGG